MIFLDLNNNPIMVQKEMHMMLEQHSITAPGGDLSTQKGCQQINLLSKYAKTPW